ncbi:hypothetical protein DMENIID0001_111900 [Sergentomyia squamirostris]
METVTPWETTQEGSLLKIVNLALNQPSFPYHFMAGGVDVWRKDLREPFLQIHSEEQHPPTRRNILLLSQNHLFSLYLPRLPFLSHDDTAPLPPQTQDFLATKVSQVLYLLIELSFKAAAEEEEDGMGDRTAKSGNLLKESKVTIKEFCPAEVLPAVLLRSYCCGPVASLLPSCHAAALLSLDRRFPDRIVVILL